MKQEERRAAASTDPIMASLATLSDDGFLRPPPAPQYCTNTTMQPNRRWRERG
ncbi:Hypothetical predicted protein, partial [Olea europaea subsp. europaea]